MKYLWILIATCLMISSTEIIQYLMFKTCWISFLLLEMNMTTPKLAENTAGLSRQRNCFFKAARRPQILTWIFYTI